MRVKTTRLFFTLIMTSTFFVRCARSDTQFFKDFFGFSPEPDVANLNCFADEFINDSSYWISFECSDSTVTRIIKNLELTPNNEETRGLFGGLNSSPRKWWDTSFVFHAIPYTKRLDTDHTYLWHDRKSKKVYFLAFDT